MENNTTKCAICGIEKTEVQMDNGDMLFAGALALNPTRAENFIKFEGLCSECIAKLNSLTETTVYGDDKECAVMRDSEYNHPFKTDEEWFNNYITPKIQEIQKIGNTALVIGFFTQVYENFKVVEVEIANVEKLEEFIASIKGVKVPSGTISNIFDVR
ncbi:hypothetical protein D3C81_08730 [compost metagenome]